MTQFKQLFFTLALVFVVTAAFAQVKVGDNPTTINPNAVLEMESTNKGMLLPRVALTSTTAAAPLTGFVAGMSVYNTATAGDVTPGYYYCDGTQWVRLATGGMSEWIDGTVTGLNAILAKQALDASIDGTADTVAITDNGRLIISDAIGGFIDPGQVQVFKRDQPNIPGTGALRGVVVNTGAGAGSDPGLSLLTSIHGNAATFSDFSGTMGTVLGGFLRAQARGTGTVNSLIGSQSLVSVQEGSTVGLMRSLLVSGDIRNGSATITDQVGVDVVLQALNSWTGSVGNLYGIRVGGTSFDSGTSAANINYTNRYGLYVGNVKLSSTATNPTAFSIYTNVGLVSFGDNVEQRGTGAFKVATGTTTERPATAEAGMIRFNTTTSKFEGYDGTNWVDLN